MSTTAHSSATASDEDALAVLTPKSAPSSPTKVADESPADAPDTATAKSNRIHYTKEQLIELSKTDVSKSRPVSIPEDCFGENGKWSADKTFFKTIQAEGSVPSKTNARADAIRQKPVTQKPVPEPDGSSDTLILGNGALFTRFLNGCKASPAPVVEPKEPRQRDRESLDEFNRAPLNMGRGNRVGSGRVLPRTDDWSERGGYEQRERGGSSFSRDDDRQGQRRFDRGDRDRRQDFDMPRRGTGPSSSNQRNTRNQNSGYDNYRNDRHNNYEEKEPEWMDAGPTSQFDFMELKGFEDDHRSSAKDVPKKKNTDAAEVPAKKAPVVEQRQPEPPAKEKLTAAGDFHDPDDGMDTSLVNEIMQKWTVDDDDVLFPGMPDVSEIEHQQNGRSRFADWLGEPQDNRRDHSEQHSSGPMKDLSAVSALWGVNPHQAESSKGHGDRHDLTQLLQKAKINVSHLQQNAAGGGVPRVNMSQARSLAELEGNFRPVEHLQQQQHHQQQLINQQRLHQQQSQARNEEQERAALQHLMGQLTSQRRPHTQDPMEAARQQQRAQQELLERARVAALMAQRNTSQAHAMAQQQHGRSSSPNFGAQYGQNFSRPSPHELELAHIQRRQLEQMNLERERDRERRQQLEAEQRQHFQATQSQSPYNPFTPTAVIRKLASDKERPLQAGLASHDNGARGPLRAITKSTPQQLYQGQQPGNIPRHQFDSPIGNYGARAEREPHGQRVNISPVPGQQHPMANRGVVGAGGGMSSFRPPGAPVLAPHNPALRQNVSANVLQSLQLLMQRGDHAELNRIAHAQGTTPAQLQHLIMAAASSNMQNSGMGPGASGHRGGAQSSGQERHGVQQHSPRSSGTERHGVEPPSSSTTQFAPPSSLHSSAPNSSPVDLRRFFGGAASNGNNLGALFASGQDAHQSQSSHTNLPPVPRTKALLLEDLERL